MYLVWDKKTDETNDTWGEGARGDPPRGAQDRGRSDLIEGQGARGCGARWMTEVDLAVNP